MPQTVRKAAAPVVGDPVWPEGYVRVLREAGAKEVTIPYCVAWVRRFFARNPGRRRRDLARPEIETFLTEIAARPGISNWQVQQARDAAEMYYEQFRGIPLDPRPDLPTQSTSSDSPPVPLAPAAPPARAPAHADAAYRAKMNGVKGNVPETEPSLRGLAGERLAGKSVADQPGPSLAARPEGGGSSGRAERVNWRELDRRLRECLRVEHYAYRTEQTYVDWIRRFVMFHGWRKPSALGPEAVHAFLRHLAIERQVSSSTQNQALNAVVFLYKKMVKTDLGDFSDFPRARRGLRLPVVASRAEIKAVIGRLTGRERLMAWLMYGTGMRINECLRLRVQDVEFDQNRIVVRGGKGDRDRYVPFPSSQRSELQQWLEGRRQQYEADKAQGRHEVEVPAALAVKYPSAPYEWRWQYVFAADGFSEDPRTGHVRRHHVDEQHIQRAVQQAVKEAGLTIRFTPHCFRHSFATHLLEAGQDIRTVQTLMGHANVQTTMIYTHVLNKGPMGVVSPADTL